jgi:hypothetical protein
MNTTILGNKSSRIMIIAIMLFAPQSASARDQILCKAIERKADVIIDLLAVSEFGRTLNCIHGDFVVDMTPCAPSGGYGLSYPTGGASLRTVVDRWQDYADHYGGVVSNYVSNAEISFAGGFNSPGRGLSQDWEFSASRLTGIGQLKLAKGRVVKYKCNKVEQKF